MKPLTTTKEDYNQTIAYFFHYNLYESELYLGSKGIAFNDCVISFETSGLHHFKVEAAIYENGDYREVFKFFVQKYDLTINVFNKMLEKSNSRKFNQQLYDYYNDMFLNYKLTDCLMGDEPLGFDLEDCIWEL